MNDSTNWRQEVTAEDYFGHQQKRLNLADRRPGFSRASDIVGPGINERATRIENFNHQITTYNGWYSAPVGTPNAPAADRAFVGMTSSDSEIGGTQVFRTVSLDPNGSVTYKRSFVWGAADPSRVLWGPWEQEGGGGSTALIRVSPLAVVDSWTPLVPGGSVMLPLPSRIVEGPSGTFSSSGAMISVLRPGVYTGSFSAQSLLGSSVYSVNYTLHTPSGASSMVSYPDINPGQGSVTATIPFAFSFSGTTGVIRLTASVDSGMSGGVRINNFYVMRVGDL